jgi:NADH:ubiquinone oxidoreductase subunit F (NADH-binding)
LNRAPIVLAACCILALPLRAQLLEGRGARPEGAFSAQNGSYYNFSSGSGCDLKISVWGAVRAPGRYDIPCETNLLEMLSYCGGPMTGADLSNIKIVRRGGVDHEDELDKVFEVNLQKYLKVTDVKSSATELLLYPGDLIIVEGVDTTVDTFLRIAQVIVAMSSLVTATVAVINIASK